MRELKKQETVEIDQDKLQKPVGIARMCPVSTSWYEFVPAQDITAYEIRKILQSIEIKIDNNYYDKLPQSTKRFFVKEQDKK